MRATILTFCFMIASAALGLAQEGTTVADGDTTIYQAVEEMPRFPACEKLDTTIEVKNQCAQQALLAFMYQNIIYPQEARENGNEGTVVASFVVEKDGGMSNFDVLRDIGGGCGVEVLRVLEGLQSLGVKWVPGRKDGMAVRTRFTLPIKFKLEELPPYTVAGRDTVYTEFEKPLAFKGGDEALEAYLNERLKYPEGWEDSCRVGRIDVQVLVRPSGEARILDMTDYNNLGFDFWYEAIDAATSTYGKWEPATYEGRAVTAAYDLRLPFIPQAAGCQQQVKAYEKANALGEEGARLFNEGDKEGGLAKMSEAITLFAGDAGLLLMRGQAYLDLKRFPEACADLSRAREISLVDWYDGVLPVICR
ncbi:MAG: energy transducer TonB [Phaeodactylibacter sp.]|nr:energy transducer TonB [Phaeodactylibacter sp.]MCB9275563.1 energy transducer TonB [Lewinellaceae bacterium]